jgi:hypothetical protein
MFLSGPEVPVAVVLSPASSVEDRGVRPVLAEKKTEMMRRIGVPEVMDVPRKSTVYDAGKMRDFEAAGMQRVRAAAEVAGRNIATLPELVSKMQNEKEVDQLVVAAVNFAADRNATAALAAASRLGGDERDHAKGLVGRALARQRDFTGAVGVMNTMPRGNERKMVLWSVAGGLAATDIHSAAQWVLGDFPPDSEDRTEALRVIVGGRVGSPNGGDLRVILPSITDGMDRMFAVAAVTRSLAGAGKMEEADRFIAGLGSEEANYAKKAMRVVREVAR